MTAHSPDGRVRGRFAPSPTGRLHFGSIVAALASFLHARHHGGQWLVRIEDLDPPRLVPGAAEHILTTLERLGLHWDGPVLYQSTREQAYREALTRLRDKGWTYPCGCTRREVAAAGVPGADGPIYPGTCRNGLPPGKRPRSTRLRCPDTTIRFRDRVQGSRSQNPAREVGDFVLRRADGLVSYQLAVVVDDAAQGVSQVVRGADLLTSTPRQILLQRLLDLPRPEYLHIPVLLGRDERKLSKREQAPALDDAGPHELIRRALQVLGQPALADSPAAPVSTLLEEAIERWNPARIPRSLEQPSSAAGQ